MPSPAWAQAPGQPPGPSLIAQFVPFILIFAIFYFLIIRPQKKRQDEHQTLLKALKKGDRVTTTGGMFGTIAHVYDDRVVLKVAENVKVEYLKSAITGVVPERADAGGKTESSE